MGRRVTIISLVLGGLLWQCAPALAQPEVEADFNGDGFADLAVGVSGIGSSGEDVDSVDRAGAVHVLYGAAGGVTSDGDQLWHQNSPGIVDTAEQADQFGRAVAAGDFNGDGFADLAVGVPGEDRTSFPAGEGAVHVIYGSAGGLTSAGDQLWHQDVSGIVDSAEQADEFGEAVAAGDFDNDGFDDLAAGIPGENLGDPTQGGCCHGAVQIVYGSAGGLTRAGDQFWHQDVPGIVDTAELGDGFGGALAVGDFNGDGFADLAAGVASEDVAGVSNRQGAVHIIYGSAGGLSAAGDQFWHQNVPGIVDDAEEFDFFGLAVAAGDFNGDGRADLAASVIEDIDGESNAGAAHVIYGSAGGLTSAGDQLWHQNVANIEDTAEAGDIFGAALGAGDFDDDGRDDLAAGVAYENLDGVADAGAVNVIYGAPGGLTSAGDQLWHQDVANIEDTAEPADFFGGALAAGDHNGDGAADLASGAFSASDGAGEDVDGIADAGAVNVIYGSATTGLTSTGDQFWHQNSPGIVDTAETDDGFGVALGATGTTGTTGTTSTAP